MKYKLTQIFVFFWRFGTLKIARKIFKNLPQPFYLKKRLFGQIQSLDASRSITQQMLYLEGERLIDERYLIAALVNNKSCLIDIGANIGYYLLMFSKYAVKGAKIICIEPSPQNLPELMQTMKLNPTINSVLYAKAIGSKKDRLTISGGVNGHIGRISEVSNSVEVVPLDDLITESVDFVKIDVEGYEMEVLKGAQSILTQYKPTLFLELHPKGLLEYGSTIAECILFVEEIYSNVNFYISSKSLVSECSVWGRFLNRVRYSYFNDKPVVEIEKEALLSLLRSENNEYITFWCVGQK